MNQPRKHIFDGASIAIPMAVVTLSFFLIYNFIVGHGKDEFYTGVEQHLAEHSKAYIHRYAALAKEYSSVDLTDQLRAFDTLDAPTPNACARRLGEMYKAIGEYEKTKADLFRGYTPDLKVDREFLRIYSEYEAIAAIRPSMNNFKYISQKGRFKDFAERDIEQDLRLALAHVIEAKNTAVTPPAP